MDSKIHCNAGHNGVKGGICSVQCGVSGNIRSCYNAAIYSESAATLSVDVKGNEGLKGGTVKCSGSHCLLTGDGYRILDGALVNAAGAESLAVALSGDSALRMAEVFCPNRPKECSFDGVGENVIDESQIYCGYSTCSITANPGAGKSVAISNVDIFAQTAAKLLVAGTGSAALNQGSFWCPRSAQRQPSCIIELRSDPSTASMVNDWIIDDVKIYADIYEDIGFIIHSKGALFGSIGPKWQGAGQYMPTSYGYVSDIFFGVQYREEPTVPTPALCGFTLSQPDGTIDCT